ncbi:MAG: 3-deoxy-D-manno-octulosonic acid transferase [Candidatus Ancaeobacter aquaticus]|nr:3-deoxy-D-manno-octulosonic acid transferase [Candidatus Ancaeobacter aquaticus]
MMRVVYNVGIYIYFIISSPYYIFSLFTREKYRAGFRSRLGFIPKKIVKQVKGRKSIWFHAVSVGEVLAVLPLIELTKQVFPQYHIVLSTTTMTSNILARNDERTGDISVVYFPLDFPWAVKKFMSVIHPQLIVLTETEIWPNFLACAASRNIPVILANGRISPNSFKHYILIKDFFKEVVKDIALFGMQSEEYSQRIIALGAPSERVVVTGNLKYDAMKKIDTLGDGNNALRKMLNIPDDACVLVGGSTHPGEDEILIDIYTRLKTQHKKLTLIIAPRHIERAQSIKNYAIEKATKVILKTNIASQDNTIYDIIILDTIGELSKIYSISDIVFVGKSLVVGGGQNILEPAFYGNVVVYGPLMDNFKEEAAELLQGDGSVQVKDKDELENLFHSLLADSERMKVLGKNAARIVEQYRGGILDKNITLIKNMLEKR